MDTPRGSRRTYAGLSVIGSTRMSFRHVGDSVLQRSSASLSVPGGLIHDPALAGASQSPLPPPGLTARSGSADSSPRPRSLLPAVATPAPFSRRDDFAVPGIHAQASPPNETPDMARQRLQAEVQKRADQAGWLESLLKDVKDQAKRVQQRLTLARQDLAEWQLAAGRHKAPEAQPADRTAARPSASASLRQLEEQVSMLAWRHRELGPRQEQVAQMLQEARSQMAAAQEQLSAMGLVRAPDPAAPSSTPPASPRVSVSDASFDSARSSTLYFTPEGSIASDVASAAPSPEWWQGSVMQLQRQASELGWKARVLEDRLDAVEAEAAALAPAVDNATDEYHASESRIARALATGDAGSRARADTEQVRLYRHMIEMHQRAEQLDRSMDMLAAQLAAVRGDLDETRHQLAEVGGGVSARHPSPLSAAGSDARAELLETALPHGSAAVVRLAERAVRRSPRTVADRLRTFFKGRPKPLEGKRLNSFTQLAHADVMAVARQGNLWPDEAADLMCRAVTQGELGTTLTPEDRNQLLAALNRVQALLAAQ